MNEVIGLSIFKDLPPLEPFEMMTAKGWLDRENFYKEGDTWKVLLKNTKSPS
jgi:hypothetical protein